jgi:hypothetical protein
MVRCLPAREYDVFFLFLFYSCIFFNFYLRVPNDRDSGMHDIFGVVVDARRRIFHLDYFLGLHVLFPVIFVSAAEFFIGNIAVRPDIPSAKKEERVNL